MFITTKFYPAREDPVAEAEQSLRRLGVDHVDLYIVHWPEGGPTWAWPGMERARELGYARSIGVSNFDVAELEQLLATATFTPVVEPGAVQPVRVPQGAPRGSASENGVVLEAYSPLGHRPPPRSETAARIAQTPRAHAGTGAVALVH